MAEAASVYPRDLEGLHNAVKRCDVELVEGAEAALLNKGDERGFTALMWAAWLGHTKVGETLIALGADLSLKDIDGQDALFHACWQGEAEFAELLLKNKADPSSRDIDGETPLMAASHQGSTAIVDLLLAHGADPTVTDRNNMTAKDHAAKWAQSKEAKEPQDHADKPQPYSHVKEMAKHYLDQVEQPLSLRRQRRMTDRSSTPGVSVEEPTEYSDEASTASDVASLPHSGSGCSSSRVQSSSGAASSPAETNKRVDDLPPAPGALPPPRKSVFDCDQQDPSWVEIEIEDEYEAPQDEGVRVSDTADASDSADVAGTRDVDDDLPDGDLDDVIRPNFEDGKCCVDVNLWKRRKFKTELSVVTSALDADEAQATDEEAKFKRDVRNFMAGFPAVVKECVICEGNVGEVGELLYCQECDDTMCKSCWRSEHQNMKRRHHVARPAPTEASRFESVAQLAVQLSRVLDNTEIQRDAALDELAKRQELQAILVENIHAEKYKRSRLSDEVCRLEAKLRETTDLMVKRDQKYQKYIQDLQARAQAEKQTILNREAEIRRHVNISTQELEEARRMFSLREAEYKLQVQTSTMRAQRAASNVEQLRVDLMRVRSEADRLREESSRNHHKLNLERMKTQRLEEENRRLLRQIHRMMPEYERSRSKSEYGTGSAGAGPYRSSTASGPPPPQPPPPESWRSSLKPEMKEALAKVKKYGIENVDNSAVDVINNNLNSVSAFEAWVIVGISIGTSGAKASAKKLLTKLHPDRTTQASLKESLRKRFQIVNHSRGLLPDR